MKSLRKARVGHRPARHLSLVTGVVAVLAAAPFAVPAPAAAQAQQSVVRGQDVGDFYHLRQDKPLWFQGGHPTAPAQALLDLLSSAAADGLDPQTYRVDAIRSAMQRVSPKDARSVLAVDRMLSQAFTDYARALRSESTASAMKYVDPALRFGPATPLRLLQDADRAPSLSLYILNMGWMNPTYAPLRRALAERRFADERERDLLRINLQRARVLPTDPRYIIVNAAQQRLYMYENNRLVDSMRVVVGQEQADRNTPMMAGYLRAASLNPYWNVPPDLVWDDVGIYVKKYGLGYLKQRGYEVLSDWSDNAVPIDPATVDWEAVKTGKIEVRVRQLPGPRNVLGKVKYTFTNPFGVYLHDTSAKELLTKDTRFFSGGCIRLQDADRLGRWLFGHQLEAQSDAPDIKVPLDKPVPVYVTYLTAVPDGASITYLDDPYGWDTAHLASFGSTSSKAATR